MKKHDRVSSVFWFIFGAYIIYSGYKLDIGHLKDPGAGLLLFISGIGVCILAAVVFIQAALSREEKTERIFDQVAWHKPIIILAAVFLYIYLFKRLGFIIDTLLLLVVLFKAVEPQRWSIALFSSALTVIIIWILFTQGFEVHFPVGILEAFGLY